MLTPCLVIIFSSQNSLNRFLCCNFVSEDNLKIGHIMKNVNVRNYDLDSSVGDFAGTNGANFTTQFRMINTY